MRYHARIFPVTFVRLIWFALLLKLRWARARTQTLPHIPHHAMCGIQFLHVPRTVYRLRVHVRRLRRDVDFHMDSL